MSIWGYVGDKKHHEFSIIGDAVNTASRIQSDTPRGNIHISRNIKNKLPEEFITNYLGEKKFKGKVEGVEVFELIDKN